MKFADRIKTDHLLALLPVLLAWLWVLLSPQMLPADVAAYSPIAPFWTSLWLSALLYLPLLLAQWGISVWGQTAQAGQQSARLGLLWLAAFAFYPACWWYWGQSDTMAYQFGSTDWLLVSGLSLLYWCQLAWQRRQRSGPLTGWSRLWSLDAVLLLLLALWTLAWACLLTSHPPGFAQQPIPVHVNWSRIAAEPGLWLWYLWQFAVLAAAMFGCYWLTRYYLIRQVLAQRGLLTFVLLSLVLILLSYAPLSWLLLQLPMNQGVAVPAVPGGSQNPFDWYNFNFMLLQWLLSTPIILAFERQQQDSALAQLRHQQVRTELQLLQQQINPHFLFNTLNNLYALCLLKSDAAPQLVLKLADLLRYVVYQGQQERVPLHAELDYLQHYLDLQQLRVSNKTTVTVEFPAETGSWQLPPLLLPPLLLIMLLENAYKHGVDTSAAASQIWLSATVSQKRLVFICRNTWPAQTANTTDTGMGLDNLRRRLQLLYGTDFMLKSGPDAAGYWHAELQLPLWPESP
ncbi:sensor histidine kinase [Rheinheimera texasensis]|uniref:sensor histidine kinase n=1 Tax=Rheinheimera texasensis TaxID=306205 RepID=UPI0032B26F88